MKRRLWRQNEENLNQRNNDNVRAIDANNINNNSNHRAYVLFKCNNLISIYFFICTYFVLGAWAVCPTTFSAQAFSKSKSTALDLYYKKSGIDSAANCAHYCGLRAECKSALYNHDAKVCALSTTNFVDCNLSRQRFNAFHLKTDGADSLSIIACIDVCRHGEIQKPDDSSAVDPTESQSKNGFRLRATPIVPSVVTSNGHDRVASDPDLPNAYADRTAALRPIIPINYPLPPLLPADIFAHSTDDYGNRKGYRNDSKSGSNGSDRGHNNNHKSDDSYRNSGSNSVETNDRKSHDSRRNKNNISVPSGPDGPYITDYGASAGRSDGYLRSPQFQNIIQKIIGGHVTVDGISRDSDTVNQNGLDQSKAIEFLRAVDQLNAIHGRLATLHNRQQSQPTPQQDLHSLKSWDLQRITAGGINGAPKVPGEDEPAHPKAEQLSAKPWPHSGKVRFSAQPLTFQEIFGGAANAREAAAQNDKPAILPHPHTQFYEGVEEDQAASGVVQARSNGSASRIHSGGFFTFLQPGEFADKAREFELANNANREAAAHQIIRQNNVDASAERTVKMASGKITVTNDTVRGLKDSRAEKLEERKLSADQTNEPAIRIPSEPIVINGRILSPKEKLELMRREHTSSTTTTTVAPWKPAGLIGESSINEPDLMEPTNDNAENPREAFFKSSQKRRGPTFDDDRGFVNTFVIHGISSLMNRHYDDDELKTSNYAAAVPPTPAAPTAAAPVVCFRSITQQRLLNAAIKRVANVSLNMCRCECANSWKNTTQVTGTVDEGRYCKSIQYYEKTRLCILNGADHNGKYDLIYDKHVDYYYVSCQIPLQSMRRDRTKTTVSTSTTTTTTTTTTALTTNPTASVASTTTVTTTTATEEPTTTKRFDELVKEEHPEDGATPKYVAEAEENTHNKNADNNNSSNNKVVNAKRKEATLIVFSRETKPFTTTTTTTKTAEPTTETTTAENEIGVDTTSTSTTAKVTTTTQAITTKPTARKTTKSATTTRAKLPKTTKTTTTVTTPTTRATTKGTTTETVETTEVGCFEQIAGYAMNASAGGLAHDVSLEQCQCLCANSMLSQRYSFQCTSATYYHKESDCILNLANRQQAPDVFVKNPLQDRPDSRITYLGLLCTPVRAMDEFADQGKCKAAARATTVPTTAASAPHTDDCFLELPNHVLEGTALAIETNVTVEECKCYCVDAEHRYGSICQSIQYYFDSATCLLNKENRITDPDQFTYDSQSNVMHSYFDYRCHVERMTLSMYVEQVCQVATQLSLKDLFKDKSSSLNIDERSKEAKSHKAFEDYLKRHDSKSGGSQTENLNHPRPSFNSTTKSPATTTAHGPITGRAHSGPAAGLSAPTRPQAPTGGPKKAYHQNAAKTSQVTVTTPVSVRPGPTGEPAKSRSGPKKAGDQSPNEYDEEEEDGEDEEEEEDEDYKRKTRDGAKPRVGSQKVKQDQARKSARPKSHEDWPQGPTSKPSIPELEELDENNNNAFDNINVSHNHSDWLSSNNNNNNRVVEQQPGSNNDNDNNNNNNDSSDSISSTTTTVATPISPQASTSPSLPAMTTVAMTTVAVPPKSLAGGGDGEKPFEYPTVGPCQYSALYQTVFNGFRMIKRVMVNSPAQCFAACHAERCRSANLVQADGGLKYCELFRDSIVDFRRTDVLGFDRGAVHFDSIQCQPAGADSH